MRGCDNFQFDILLDFILDHWPETIFLETEKERNTKISDLYSIEENISEKFIGMRYELIYRGLSYSVFICLQKLSNIMHTLSVRNLRHEYIRETFEERLSKWKESEEGITSDLAGRMKYYKDNNMAYA